MDCNETRRLLEADVDGELDLVRHLELEAHLRTCPACLLLAEKTRARRAAMRTAFPRLAAPDALKEKIRAALQAEAGTAVIDPITPAASAAEASASGPGSTSARPPRRARLGRILPFWQIAQLAACIAIAAGAGFTYGTRHANQDRLLHDTVADHIRSLQVDHLTDVASTDQHTVKPWFSGKLAFSPPVVDLVASGFPLIGGRLETINGETAAALVFHRRKHAINLFIWPHASGSLPAGAYAREGFNVQSWTQADLAFVAVSEIPAAELAQFATDFQQATR